MEDDDGSPLSIDVLGNDIAGAGQPLHIASVTDAAHGTVTITDVKGKVAFDLEWNAKDQTFDRDLAAFRAFFDYGRISVGVLVTRDVSLVPYFVSLGKPLNKAGVETEGRVVDKYGHEGGSTTHMNKLLPRMSAGRSGGCPVLAFGITPKLRSPRHGYRPPRLWAVPGGLGETAT